jgi:hypothetical protein
LLFLSCSSNHPFSNLISSILRAFLDQNQWKLLQEVEDSRIYKWLALGEISLVRFVTFRSCRCKFNCRCSCVLDAVVMLLCRLNHVWLKLCNVSKF